MWEDPGTWPFRNDFLSVFLEKVGSRSDENAAAKAGIYRNILDGLRKMGASFAGLSGSGSCCFGVFNTRETAERVVKELDSQEFFVKLTFFLAQNINPVVEY